MTGIGTDLIEIARVKDAHEKHGDAFLDRLFTKKEQEYCLHCQNPYPRLSGRFAAKEAISKALGTGFGEELSWKDIEILPDDKGKPIVHLSEKALQHFQNPLILVSISHVKEFALAFATVKN